MKTLSTIIATISLLSLVSGALAQGVELPNPGLTPDNPFYFLETIAEKIVTFFTFGDLKKAERYANLAIERLAETKAVIDKGRSDLAEKTLARYEMQLENSIAMAEKAQQKGENTQEVMAKVGQATSLHLEVLAEVYEKVPEQAKSAIENAMEVSIKGHERAVEALKSQNALGGIPEEVSLPESVPQEVKDRVQQKLEADKILESVDTSKSLRDICQDNGGTPEMCEQFPLEKFESFEQVEDFCLEKGGPADICSSLEQKCRELGVTTANECFILLSVSSIKTFQSTELNVSPVPTLPEEEMEYSPTATESPPTTSETHSFTEETIETPVGEGFECEYNEMIFYYREGCSHCQRVKEEGTIEKIEGLGVKVSQIDVTVGPIQHQLLGVPSFVIGGQVYTGYRSFDQIKDLLGCR